MRVTLAGLGCGTAAALTEEVRAALAQADYLVGAARLLSQLPAGITPRRESATKPQEIVKLLLASGCQNACVLYSGDTGFYSGARSLLPLLQGYEIETRVLPGISSVQYLAAKLGRPWQEWVLCSAHGVDCDAVDAVSRNRPACFLTGGTLGPTALCRQLAEAGLGPLPVTVGENLSYPEEHIESGTAAEFARRHGCVTVLKGPGTIVASPDGRLLRNTTGGSGMAKGGSGDILAGMILSLLGQGSEAAEAASCAVWLHGRAGELAERELTAYAMTPLDLLERLSAAFKELEE